MKVDAKDLSRALQKHVNGQADALKRAVVRADARSGHGPRAAGMAQDKLIAAEKAKFKAPWRSSPTPRATSSRSRASRSPNPSRNSR